MVFPLKKEYFEKTVYVLQAEIVMGQTGDYADVCVQRGLYVLSPCLSEYV